MTLLRSITTVGGYTLLSRLLGFTRDILMAAILGAGWVADCFFVAFKLPNFFRRLFAEGAFNAAFVPLFSGHLATGGHEQARRFAEIALALLLAVLVIVVGLIQLAMPWAMYVLAPGFIDEPEKFDLAVLLTRITFPYLLFISLVSLLGGILNSLGRFAAAAATPILLNLCLIGALLLLVPFTETPGHALAWGVAAAGAIQFLWLIVACGRAGMSLRLPRPRLTPEARELLSLMAPGVVGAGAVQINLVIDIVLASLLASGSLSYLFYADRLNQLPIGVIGVAAGTALLPLLSRHLAAGAEEDAARAQNRAIEFALLLTLPAAAALMTVSGPLISVLFERGAFGESETRATALALVAYAAGLPAYVLIKVLGPAYFARKDMKTPVKFAIIAVAANLVLNIILMIPLKHVGLALATALSAWLNVSLLWITLRRRGHVRPDRELRRRIARIVVATAVMAAVLWWLADFLEPLLSGALGARIGALAILVFGGMAVYLAVAALIGAVNLREVGRFLGGRGAPGG